MMMRKMKKSFYYFYGRTRFYSIFSSFLVLAAFSCTRRWFSVDENTERDLSHKTLAQQQHSQPAHSSVATKMKNENWQKSCSCQEQNELSCENNLELQYLCEVEREEEGGKEAETETLHIKIEDSNFSTSSSNSYQQQL